MFDERALSSRKWGRRELHGKFYSENTNEKDHMGDVRLNRLIVLKIINKMMASYGLLYRVVW